MEAMSDPVESLTSLRAFVAAAETRSFKAAGQMLGVSSSAISKTIARLERQLSASLFHRTTRTISLTEAGSLFLLRARRILDELQAGEAELAEASGTPRGRLRVSLPVTGELLTNALAKFVMMYPLVELDLDYNDRLVDVIDEGFDVVIRTGDAGDSRLLHRPLGRFGWKLVASPSYVARRGKPQAPADLLEHVCLRSRYASGLTIPWALRSAPALRVPTSLIAGSSDALLDLTLAGAGIGSFPDFLVRGGLASGVLTPILEGELEQSGIVTMLWPASRYRVPKVRAFVDCIAQHNNVDGDQS